MSYHQFKTKTGESIGSFEVFWNDEDSGPWSDERRNFDQGGDPFKPGWYWQAGFPGRKPDGYPMGPYKTEQKAIKDASEMTQEQPPNFVQMLQNLPWSDEPKG